MKMRIDGFTLIELLVVVAIIGILVSLAFPVISNARESARIAAARIDMQSIITATEQYATDYRKLPVPGAFQGNSKNPWKAWRTWNGNRYGVGTIRIELQGFYSETGCFERLGLGWKAEYVEEDSPERKLLEILIATLQGSDKYDLNPREQEYLRRQEGRPIGLYMDPWSKGTTMADNPDNRQYNLLLDHNMNGFIHFQALNLAARREKNVTRWVVKNRLVVARCHGPNRTADNDMASDDFDDIFSISQEEFEQMAKRN